ncbi:MAG: three-Cys-motif partner protein TcmP [Verrucomicrobiae bacterium]|nr:three-Cys-motif partner protein TcmP [Verrucomicrobiae bacterium]
MPREEFHDKPYDEGTLTKLRIFELYVQEWLPVFLSQPDPPFEELHIFDFFAGPGMDANGVLGSPLRILRKLQDYQKSTLAGWGAVRKAAHFFDLDATKIEALQNTIASESLEVPGVDLDLKPREFSAALQAFQATLENPRAAKLLIIDQFGVDAVSDAVFLQLTSLPTTDFIFFLSSSTLHRFREHPSIKQKIANIDDSYHVHRAAFDYYKKLVPRQDEVFLGQFSIRKRSNIYGLIFGSQHPLGIHKFLQVAWKNDQIAGEANFDVERENIGSNELLLGFEEMKPRKIQSFEKALAEAVRAQLFCNEADIIKFCIEGGMTAQHAAPVIAQLKKEKVIAADFRVPNVRNTKTPRPITYP